VFSGVDRPLNGPLGFDDHHMHVRDMTPGWREILIVLIFLALVIRRLNGHSLRLRSKPGDAKIRESPRGQRIGLRGIPWPTIVQVFV
jgi:hypothetical protein